MTNRLFCIILIVLGGAVLCGPSPAAGMEIRSNYALISFAGRDDLRTFNSELYMGRLKSRMEQGGVRDTLEEEVAAKLDFIVEKVMTVLDMFPPKLYFSIVIRPDVKAVEKDFKQLYNTQVHYIAFYSPSRNKVFFSADSATLRVVAHEIGHVVAENYFTISPPQRIHEVIAQFAEVHVTD